MLTHSSKATAPQEPFFALKSREPRSTIHRTHFFAQERVGRRADSHMTKRLLITALLDQDTNAVVIPVNSDTTTHIQSILGDFGIRVFIRDFDGSEPHRANSLLNVCDSHYLDGNPVNSKSDAGNAEMPNLRLVFEFNPKSKIEGPALSFGNNLEVPVKDYIPASLISTGLKFFNWFVTSKLQSDIYADTPYIYGSALNGFTFIKAIPISQHDKPEPFGYIQEDMSPVSADGASIPIKAEDRKAFFSSSDNCKSFSFEPEFEYKFLFETNLLKLGNSNYSICIPVIGGKSFELDVGKYSNEKLSSFNWVLGRDASSPDTLRGLRINFALVNED